MKREAQKPKAAVLRLLVLSALAAAVGAASLCGQSQAGSQPQSTREKCTSAATGPDAPMTQAQGEAILTELRAIHLLLENGGAASLGARQRPGPYEVKMRIEPGWYALGNANAPVTVVEFTDLQCPFCRRFHTTTFARLKKDYIDTGKVRFIARDLPLPMHSYALQAAEAARCAGDQGKFWEFRDAVLDDQAPPTTDVLLKHATELGLTLNEFHACIDDGKYAQLIQGDRSSASAAGIHGTPAFVIGRVGGGWISGLAVQGARPLPFFQRMIEEMLNGLSAEPAKPKPAGTAGPSQASGSASKR
ncbi:MAG TPA: DsbA family protein [Terriglobia bacterium]|nr:DsbA family protein [Terriglobia bacterium]